MGTERDEALREAIIETWAQAVGGMENLMEAMQLLADALREASITVQEFSDRLNAVLDETREGN